MRLSEMLAAVVALAVVAVAVAAGPEPVLKRTIGLPGVEGRIDHMAYDPQTKRLFVVALGNGSLEVIDLEKGERIKSVGGLKEPQGVVYVASTKQVVVACGGDGTVRGYDAATLEEKERVAVGDDADNMRLDPDGKSIMVGHSGGAIAILDVRTLTKTGDIRLSDHPEAFEAEPGTSRLFINIPGGLIGGGGDVVVADRSTRKVTATWTLKEAGRNFPMALDAPHKRIYVGCRRPAKLLVIDTETGKVVASPDCVGDADEVFVDGASGRVLVVGGDGAIDVLETRDQTTYSKVASVKTGAGARTGLLVPERRALYVAVPKRSGQQAEVREYLLGD